MRLGNILFSLFAGGSFLVGGHNYEAEIPIEDPINAVKPKERSGSRAKKSKEELLKPGLSDEEIEVLMKRARDEAARFNADLKKMQLEMENPRKD